MQPRLTAALTQRLGARITRAQPLSGGDINQAFAIDLSDGRSLFLKTHQAPPPGMFGAEAAGLAFLAEASALRVPEVIDVADGSDGAHENGGPAYLLLERIDSAPPCKDHAQRLGRGLAALHRCQPARFGLASDNFIATLPQDNRQADDWPSFYASRRLEPQLRMAVDAGRVSDRLVADFQRLWPRLPQLCGPPEPPARLHGDLWGGNAITDARGEPVLIDPAVYGGHREIDLAMMRLFGGFEGRCFDAYAEAFPLAPGHAARVALYQLYPLMVHVNLFGGGYARQVQALLSQLL